MNKITYFILILLITGCSDFLEEYSQNELRPSSVVDLDQILLGEAYPLGATFLEFLDLMTDDVESNYTSSINTSIYKEYYAPFTWRKDMFERMKEAIGVDSYRVYDTYDHYYRRIMGCNVVLDMLDDVSGTVAEKENIKGQALGLRAYFYFMLVNCFGQPYNAAELDITKSPGVPIILSSEVSDEYPVRSSIAEVYELIEKDLMEALELMENYGEKNSKYKVTSSFVLTLLSRIYLYQEKWEKAEEYATMALAKNGALLDFKDIPYPVDGSRLSRSIYSWDSPEVVWYGYTSQQEYYIFTSIYSVDNIVPFTVSTSLRNCYDSDLTDPDNRKDLRLRYYHEYSFSYFTSTLTLIYGRKAPFGNTNFVSKGFRVAELYLNRSEANIQMGIASGNSSLFTSALQDLNYLRKHRYDTRNVPYEEIQISDAEELLQFCRDERRRELCFEDHRWFDLRRYGMPRIEHVFRMSDDDVQQTYILEEQSDRYVFPIPTDVLEKNPRLIPNP